MRHNVIVLQTGFLAQTISSQHQNTFEQRMDFQASQQIKGYTLGA